MNTTLLREEELFEAARQISDPAKRRAFLDFSCPDEPELRTRLEGLLTAADEAEGFFAAGATIVDATELALRGTRSPRDRIDESRPAPHAEEPIGSMIGRYKLLQKLGEGGCGIVYLAEQQEPVRRHVALKIIKLGMESRTVIARFEAERQALAMMDHPNIARVFDAGETERGSPYFVMEHVRGVKITEYCDTQQLPVRDRLDLFIQVCHAIQHAHQKGIVHGDIKPSNILIALHDGVAGPKVIDFGISNATEAHLTERRPFLTLAQLIGTPAYMSPEQLEVNGLDVDTRSDIYSLGVLLYELLTGLTPFDGKQLIAGGVESMRRMLREAPPVRPAERFATLEPEQLKRTAAARRSSPAQLTAMLREDLDWIALKALEKDRRRRYETANGLAMDLHRFLQDEPVVAHPASWWYRTKKLVRRNRGVFLAGSAVALALIIGTAVSTWLFLKERDARQRAVAAEQQQVRLRHEAEMREKITQAALFVSQERFAEADALLSAVTLTQSTMEGSAVFRALGEWHAIENRWKQAVDRFQQVLRVDQLDGIDAATLDYLRTGPALIEMGDFASYQEFRYEAVKRFADRRYRPAPVSSSVSNRAPAASVLKMSARRFRRWYRVALSSLAT